MRYPTVIRFLVSNALSLLGNSISAVVLPLVLLARTGDVLAAGTLAIVCAVPQVAAGVLGGAALDRLNRRSVSAVSDCISALSVALLPIVDATVGLSFGWFVALGVLGAVGDIPGMTARDTLLPAVAAHDGADLQRFVGIAQALDALVVIVGPAAGALCIGLIGDVQALWITTATSLAAALVTITLPRAVGVAGKANESADEDVSEAEHADAGAEGSAHKIAREDAAENEADSAPHAPQAHRPHGILRAAVTSLREGLGILFASDRVLRASLLLELLITMAMAGVQGLVLPAHFTDLGQPERLGLTVSALAAGQLAGTLGYSALAPRLTKRTWYVTSLVGMATAMLVLCQLPPYPLLLAGAALLGLSAGPLSALLGFFVFDRIPDARRGAALGTQNSLLLVMAPFGVFATSVIVQLLGIAHACWAILALWIAITAVALAARSMRSL